MSNKNSKLRRKQHARAQKKEIKRGDGSKPIAWGNLPDFSPTQTAHNGSSGSRPSNK